MILECQLDGESVEIITRAYGNVQVGIKHHCCLISATCNAVYACRVDTKGDFCPFICNVGGLR